MTALTACGLRVRRAELMPGYFGEKMATWRRTFQHPGNYEGGASADRAAAHASNAVCMATLIFVCAEWDDSCARLLQSQVLDALCTSVRCDRIKPDFWLLQIQLAVRRAAWRHGFLDAYSVLAYKR